MPYTTEQERIRQLFGGNTLANKQLPVVQQDQVLSPIDYNSPKSSNPARDAVGEMPLLTTTMAPRTSYQDAIRNRFNSITGMGTDATDRSRAAAQAAAWASSQVPQTKSAGGYQYKGAMTGNAEIDKLLSVVAAQKGMPYSWGGGNSKGPSYGIPYKGKGSEGIYGFDCSGLVQYAYAQIGIKLPRHSDAQLASGVRVPQSKAKAGDLVGKPGHIAIYAGNGMMWEAPTFGKSVRLVPVRDGMFYVSIKGVG